MTENQFPQPYIIVIGTPQVFSQCFLVTDCKVTSEVDNPDLIVAAYFIFDIHYPPGFKNLYSLLEVIILSNTIKKASPSVKHLYSSLMNKIFLYAIWFTYYNVLLFFFILLSQLILLMSIPSVKHYCIHFGAAIIIDLISNKGCGLACTGVTVTLDQVCNAHFFRGVSHLYLRGVSLTLNMVCVLVQALHTYLGVYHTLRCNELSPSPPPISPLTPPALR